MRCFWAPDVHATCSRGSTCPRACNPADGQKFPGRCAVFRTETGVPPGVRMWRWIDATAHVAYTRVNGASVAMPDLLALLDSVLADPGWQPGIPIVSDLRDLVGAPEPHSSEAWRVFLGSRRGILTDCRLALILRGENQSHIRFAEAARAEAATHGVTLRWFTHAIDAHEWVALEAAPTVSTATSASGSPSL